MEEVDRLDRACLSIDGRISKGRDIWAHLSDEESYCVDRKHIAEGSARGTSKDFKQFVMIARGSTCELLTQLVITSRLALVEPAKIKEAEELANEVGRMLSGLQDFLSKPKASQHQDLTTKN